ncbi:MAG TPA: EamA family transporter [Casimicrobiaceae bacterium]|nr:EamA family transporter [Casimicrobiaceae bacterium]
MNERRASSGIRDAPAAPTQRSALVSLHAAVLLFGVAGLFGKWLALSPELIVLGRTAIASVALATLLRVLREPSGGFEWRLAAGGAVLALHWIAFFRAVQMSSVAVGLLGFASFPLFVLIVEAIFLRRRLHLADWVTVALVTSGLLLLVPEFRIENRVVQGLCWGMLSGLMFALLTVGNRALVSRRSATGVALWQNACAAACLLPGFALDPVLPTPRDVALLIALGVVCTALAHTLFIRSMRVLSAHTASVIAALEPVYGIALAFALLGEAPGWRTLIGAALIVGAALRASSRADQGNEGAGE